MPVTEKSSPRPLTPPYELGCAPDTAIFPRDTVISVLYRTEPEALEALLPPGFVAPAPVVQFRYRRAEGLDWIDDGVVSAVGISVGVRYERADPPVAGVFWPALWEDDFMAAALGPLVMGVAKRLGEVHASLDVAGHSRCIVAERGRPFIEIRFDRGEELSEQALDDVRANAARVDKVLGFRQIPSVDQTTTDLCQVTSYPIVTEVRRAWTGAGEARVFETDPEASVYAHPVVAAIANIPLVENLGALLVQSSFEIHISKGEVVDSRGPSPR